MARASARVVRAPQAERSESNGGFSMTAPRPNSASQPSHGGTWAWGNRRRSSIHEADKSTQGTKLRHAAGGQPAVSARRGISYQLATLCSMPK
mmetsp:Transcript_9628/g.29331  ORF Transcript_9628/g.29331 Transcript_9628/m.29331 type:complete len:93 (-) Transcript_9628:1079-1357(-)|eukprot:scaffold155529_cov28-Tisochrysis_lutea.AAC.1